MADHKKLIEQLDLVNRLSTEERLDLARKQREEQVKRWILSEESHLKKVLENSDNDSHASKGRFRVSFDPCTTLLDAAARNDVNEVLYLLQEQKIDPNQTNEDGLSALHQACIDNFDEVVIALLDNGADANSIDSELWTPLHAACTCGNTNISRILVERNANLLALNADQNMPYDICEEEDTLHYIEGAMAAQGITQAQINDMRSAEEREIIGELSAQIRENCFDPNKQDETEATCLHYAAAHGFLELAKFLLDHGADLNAKDADGWTPLHAAACWCQIEMVEAFGFEYFADPSIKNLTGEIPADVTDDDVIKSVLGKIKHARAKQKSKSKFGIPFHRFTGGSTSRRSGQRGQSIRGRSKRDKRKGISAVEAMSEAQSLFKTPSSSSQAGSPSTTEKNGNNPLLASSVDQTPVDKSDGDDDVTDSRVDSNSDDVTNNHDEAAAAVPDVDGSSTPTAEPPVVGVEEKVAVANGKRRQQHNNTSDVVHENGNNRTTTTQATSATEPSSAGDGAPRVGETLSELKQRRAKVRNNVAGGGGEREVAALPPTSEAADPELHVFREVPSRTPKKKGRGKKGLRCVIS